MDVDYCPKCHKAGLRYERIETLAWKPDPRTEAEKDEYLQARNTGKKWCPRCKEWIDPTRKNVMDKRLS